MGPGLERRLDELERGRVVELDADRHGRGARDGAEGGEQKAPVA